MQEHAERPDGTAYQRSRAEGQRVADAAADGLIDHDEVGQHPAPQVMPGQDLVQRGAAVILRRRPVSGADIYCAGRGGQIAVLARLAACGRLTRPRAAPAARKMRQVPGLLTQLQAAGLRETRAVQVTISVTGPAYRRQDTGRSDQASSTYSGRVRVRSARTPPPPSRRPPRSPDKDQQRRPRCADLIGSGQVVGCPIACGR